MFERERRTDAAGRFLLALAFDRGGAKKAVLLVAHRGRSHTVLDSAMQSDLISYDTPVVNLLQNLSVDTVRNCWLYATYEPDEMDLGMACMRGVAGIVYPSGPNAALQRSLSDQTGPGAPVAYSGGDNDFNLFITGRVNMALDRPWGRRSKWEDQSWLAGWIQALGKTVLTENAKALRESYLKLQAPFVRRPANEPRNPAIPVAQMNRGNIRDRLAGF
jgi:hypothetical protein